MRGSSPGHFPCGSSNTGENKTCFTRCARPCRKLIATRQNLLDAHLIAAMKSVRSVAPRTAQIAARQAHENAWQASACAFALNRLENFRDDHTFGVPQARLLLFCRSFMRLSR